MKKLREHEVGLCATLLLSREEVIEMLVCVFVCVCLFVYLLACLCVSSFLCLFVCLLECLHVCLLISMSFVCCCACLL